MNIFGIRSNMLGDQIACEPILRLLEKKFPKSKKTWAVAKKSQSSIQFLKSHPLIDSILVSNDGEGDFYSINGQEYNQQIERLLGFDYQINVNPKVVNSYFFNDSNLIEQNFLMAGFSKEDYLSLSEEDRKPKLYRDFELKKVDSDKSVLSIHAFAGYSKCTKRSPSLEWWGKLITILKEKYELIQIGHFDDPDLGVKNITESSLLEQFQYILATDLYLGVEGGLAWICGAYGEIPQVNLLTNLQAGHVSNEKAWAPETRNQKIDLFEWNDINNISHELVIKSIEILLKN